MLQPLLPTVCLGRRSSLAVNVAQVVPRTYVSAALASLPYAAGILIAVGPPPVCEHFGGRGLIVAV